MQSASEYLAQVKPRPLKYTVVHMAQVWRYHNLRVRGIYVDVRA